MDLLGAIVQWSLRHRPAVLAAVFGLCLLGWRAADRLPIDAVPDITTIQVRVVTSAPALAPLEIEQYVSIPVERAMQGIPDVTEVRSLSRYGLSVVTVVFTDDTDIYFARQLVSERMAEARASIPEGYGVPQMGPVTTGLGEIYQFTVRNDSMSLMELEELLDWTIGPRLRSVPGVVEVDAFGGEDREYRVTLDPSLVQAAGLSTRDVVEALERANANAGGGYIERNGEHFVIGSQGLVTGLEDLRAVVLGATPQGVPITLGEVSEVAFAPRLRRGAASMDGEEVVAGVSLMLMGENPRTVVEGIEDELSRLQPSLPPGTRIEPFYDRTELVDRTVRTAVVNLAEGALLVVVVLLLLLGDLRAGLVVATVIPLSMLITLVCMDLMGISGNLMSLGALDFGIIVDGAVIVVENASRRLGDRVRALDRPLSLGERTEVVRAATMEVRRPTVYGECIIAVVYVPILMLTGTEGKLFGPMATTVLFALGGAFVLSLTWIPVLASSTLRPAGNRRPTVLMRLAHAAYRPVLDRVLRHRRTTVALGLVVLAGTALLFGRLGAQFVPRLDEGDLVLEVRRLPSVALSESVDQDLRIQRALLPIPEVEHVVCRTGSPQLALDPMSVAQTDAFIRLRPRERWRAGLTHDQLVAEIEQRLEQKVPEVAVSVSQPIEMRTNELVAGVRADVGILLYGPELSTLTSHGQSIRAAIEEIPGVVGARVETLEGLRTLRVVPDREKLARYGLTVADVNLAVETMAVGHRVGQVLEGDRSFSIRVAVAHDPPGDLDAMASLPLRSAAGHMVPLGDVARLRFVEGPASIGREAQSRRVVVQFDVRGRDVVSVVEQAQAAVESEVELPPGYRIAWGGSFEHYEQAKRRLAVVVPVALAAIAFLLWSAFGRVRPALVVLLNVPFAAVGGVVALWWRDLPLSISAGVGFIALLGVAVLNGLVLVEVARRRRAAGHSPRRAIRHAAVLRLRPVLMTAFTDVLGFVPMALSTAPGAEVQRPLATVVIGGVSTVTLLTLLLLPALYCMVERPAPSGEEDD